MAMGHGFDNVFVGEVADFRIISFKQMMTPKKVIFNNPATIVYWEDGSKTVVKCGSGDMYDCEKGFAMCVLKRLYGDDFHRLLKTHVPDKIQNSNQIKAIDMIINIYRNNMYRQNRKEN